MNLESLRAFCLSLPGATADIKWGQDLVFSVGKKMFCAVNTEPPHQCSFKTSDEDFAELIEREGMRPAPYLARVMWVQEEQLGETLDRSERERLLRQASRTGSRKAAQAFARTGGESGAEKENYAAWRRPAISSRPCNIAPSSTLTAGADKSPAIVAVLLTTIRAFASKLPFTVPPTTIVWAMMSAAISPESVTMTGCPVTSIEPLT